MADRPVQAWWKAKERRGRLIQILSFAGSSAGDPPAVSSHHPAPSSGDFWELEESSDLWELEESSDPWELQ